MFFGTFGGTQNLDWWVKLKSGLCALSITVISTKHDLRWKTCNCHFEKHIIGKYIKYIYMYLQFLKCVHAVRGKSKEIV